MKKIITILITFTMMIAFAGLMNVEAATVESKTYTGNNKNDQNYSVYGSTVQSDLIVTNDNQLMRVQGNASDDAYLVQYYDKNYHITKEMTVDEELSIYGGFYTDGSYYYILSGQKNENEDDSVEVYRITKYDTSWKRIGSCGLYGANTYIPFDAGSARMTNDGNLLFIRTCHEMYKSSDGNHHQANVTIEVNTDDLKVVDSYYGVMNSMYGYVSHSFNQFIQLDDGHIVGVDHGDAYPRAVALLKYKNAYSSTGFSKNTTCKTMLSISGTTGANATGVSVGGFEVSSNNYLVAGNAVEMGDNYSASGTRNIFISTVDKDLSNDPEIHYITNYSSDDKSPSTPQFVKLDDDNYMLLWKQNGKINYCKIDGEGNKVGSIYTMDGDLSDCKPIVYNNTLTWYTWYNESINFYSINLKKLASTNVKETRNGHFVEYINATEDSNLAYIKCTECDYSESFTTLDSFNVIWWKGYTGYYSLGTLAEGVEYTISTRSTSPSDADNTELVLSSSDESVVSTNGKSFTTKKAGTATLTIYAKYRPSTKITQKITVEHTWEETARTEPTLATPGTITYTCSVCGDTKYEKQYMLGIGEKTIDCDKDYVFVPDETGYYRFTSDSTSDPKVKISTDSYSYVLDDNRDNSNAYDFKADCYFEKGVKYSVAFSDLKSATSYNVTISKAVAEISSVSKNSSGVKIIWNSAENGCGDVTYRIYRKAGNGSKKFLTDVTSSISYTDTTATSNIDYTYYLEYVDSEGNALSSTDKTGKTAEHTHEYDSGKITRESTCSVKGIRTYTCNICGKTKQVDIALDPTVHTWDAGTVTTKATCSSTGVLTYKCTGCGATKTEKIAKNAANHTGKTVVKNQKAATCAKTGYSGDTYCADCGVLLAKGKTVAATGKHTWDAGTVTTEPTCVEQGEELYTCTVCGMTKTEKTERNPENHIHVSKLPATATNTSAGLSEGSICDDCGEIVVEQEPVDAISTVKLYLHVNKSYTLTSNSTASWKLTSTKYKKYVSLSKSKITIKKAGTVKVKDSKSGKSVKITIKTPTISMNKTSVSITHGKTYQLVGKATPAATVTYSVVSSKYKKYATVTKGGLIKGVKKGKCYIYAKANGVSKKIKVTVK